MSEILTIRLSSDATSPIPWLVWSPTLQNVIASGEADSLAQLKTYSKEREIVALVDGSAVSVISVEIPKGSERQLETVLPYLLEDELTQDVEHLHFSLLSKKGSTADVAIVSHHQMESWRGRLEEVSMPVRRLIPDFMALPVTEDAVSVGQLQQQWLVRADQKNGATLDWEWLPLWLTNQSSDSDSDDVSLLEIACYSPLPEEEVVGNWRVESEELFMLTLAQEAHRSTVNLLTGRYKQQSQLLKYIKPWRPAAIAATLVAAVLAGEQFMAITQMESQVDAYRQQSEQRVRSVLTGIRKIPTERYLRRIVNNEVERLAGSGDSSGSVLLWLSELRPMLASVPVLTLESLRYDGKRQELRMNARSKDFSDFERLRGALSDKYQTDLGQLKRDGSGVTGSFVLRRKQV
ncbi:type II secretion system protein GspL [Veronia pacifica]|uniref:Type II secretion system protein L n=1 Tax=Veronia pacifica TaxID=1080227 RepID=A0A1C3EJQ0_9GAMM|nr:type II secretion system protein GspL [Veronia pacifica]ODA33465.1 type II secretion system protein GspL [Veronia pacifica]